MYDFTKHQRGEQTQYVQPADVVIIEGILVLHMDEVREMLNMKIYVDTDDDVRLARRWILFCGSYFCRCIRESTLPIDAHWDAVCGYACQQLPVLASMAWKQILYNSTACSSKLMLRNQSTPCNVNPGNIIGLRLPAKVAQAMSLQGAHP